MLRRKKRMKVAWAYFNSSGAFHWSPEQAQQAHREQIGRRDYCKCWTKTVVGHDSASDHRPKRNRNESDEVIETKRGIEKLLADKIGEERLGQGLPRSYGGAVNHQIEEQSRGNIFLPSEPEGAQGGHQKRGLDHELAVETIGNPTPNKWADQAAHLNEGK